MPLPQQHPLQYEEHVFDWRGLRAPTVAAGALAALSTPPMPTAASSVFVQQLQQVVGQLHPQYSTERPLSNDSEVMDEFIASVTEELLPSTDVQLIVQTLRARVMARA